MKLAEMRERVNDYALNHNLYKLGYSWMGDNVFSDGEFEYQLTDYSNGDFRSIIVRICDDMTHSYRELFRENYEIHLSDSSILFPFEDYLDEVFGDVVIDEIIRMMDRRMVYGR